MTTDITRRNIERLRADLMATNKAIAAIFSTLSDDQAKAAFATFAMYSVMNSDTVDARPMQLAPALQQLMQESEDRMQSMLQSARRVRGQAI